MNKPYTRLDETTATLHEVQKKIDLGNPRYSDAVRTEIARSLAMIADELRAIRSQMPRANDQSK